MKQKTIGAAMVKSITGSLASWGTSQGVRIPKDICELLGVHVGDVVTMVVDEESGELTLSFSAPEPKKYRRKRRVSLQELCENWEGERVGKEWSGPDVGAEEVL